MAAAVRRGSRPSAVAGSAAADRGASGGHGQDEVVARDAAATAGHADPRAHRHAWRPRGAAGRGEGTAPGQTDTGSQGGTETTGAGALKNSECKTWRHAHARTPSLA